MSETGKSRILIVDDIEENLKVLTDTLVRDGYHPLQAKSGERAVQIAKAALPDLILLDIRMPGMDGFETIQVLKADAATRDIGRLRFQTFPEGRSIGTRQYPPQPAQGATASGGRTP